MADVKAIRWTGTDAEWNEYAAKCKIEGKHVGDEVSLLIKNELNISQCITDNNNSTASNHQDRLRDQLKITDLSHTIMKGSYHVIINDIGLIISSRHDLTMRVTNAVHGAVYRYWIKLWGDMLGFGEEQMNTKCSTRNLKEFNKAIGNIIVTYTVDIPQITLSDLREVDLGKVVQFDCVIVGPTPKKLDEETGKYIQKVLIQEPESSSKDNNPVMILAILHGEDTNYIASGMNKRFIGVYTVAPTKEGTKASNEKTLIIDTISVQDLEEKAEVTLSQYEIDETKLMAEQHEDLFIQGLIDSFCPKILGRELEKKALYLSMLGGSDVSDYRKEIHTMLCADADSGKSELIKFAHSIHWKSSLVDGSSSTGVGLTFALDKYEDMMILRQGAMILNNGGCMFVDEYDKMAKPEQKKLNQAQEQQRATYNKGGHKGDAECKTTVIACCNPTNERWVESDDIIDNLPFDSSTISRYDLIIRSRHMNHENQVRAKLKHITSRKRGELGHVANPKWMAGLLNYQRKLNPVMPEDVEDVLISKFVDFTQIPQEKGSLQIQTRQMEGIIRLTEAWAKMLFQHTITVKIVEDVIQFYQECMATLGMNVEKGITQFDMRGHSTNKETYFKSIFKELEDDNGHVSITILSEKLQENNAMFNTDNSVASYVRKLESDGYLYEPRLGEFKRQ